MNSEIEIIKRMAEFIELIDIDDNICKLMEYDCDIYKNCTQCIIECFKKGYFE